MTHIDELGLSTRASHCLLSAAVPPIVTVEALASTSDSELMRIPNFGRVSLAECRAAQRQWLHEHQADDRLLSLARSLRQCADLIGQCAALVDSLAKYPPYANGRDSA